MISLIIPTMWKYAPFHEFLMQCLQNPHVSDCVLIDNDHAHAPDNLPAHHKLNRINYNTNLFVNPSWNLGVYEAKSPIMCFQNDDIQFDTHIYDHVVQFTQHTPNWGMLGLLRDACAHGAQGVHMPLAQQQFPNGVGRLFFVQRQNWIDIPAEIPINYGDFFQWRMQAKRQDNYFICNLPHDTPDSQTSRFFTHVYAQESEQWLQICDKYGIDS